MVNGQLFKILRLYVNTLSVDDKHSLYNRDNLTQPIHMQLSQKQKTFSGIFFPFLKSILTIKRFQKKMNLIAHEFRKLRTPKTWLDNCLTSPISEDPSISNMKNGPKRC